MGLLVLLRLPLYCCCADVDHLGHVLIVGDGDFSFSRAVASIRGSHVPGDLQCTSLDSASTVTAKYPCAQQHLASLHTHPSCTVRHSIDATNLHGTNFSGRLFNRRMTS